MPRKTLGLIIGLVLVTVILFIIALKTGQDQKPVKQQQTMQPSVTPDVVHSVLSMSPDPVTVASGQQGKVEVNIDTADNKVTGVQLELAYDPTMLSNVKVAFGTMFTNPLVLFNKDNPQKGTFTYAYGIQPGQQPVSGKGVVATITFTAVGPLAKESKILMLPTTLVTARAAATSVLKTSSGTTVVIGAPTTTTVKTVPVVSTKPAQ